MKKLFLAVLVSACFLPLSAFDRSVVPPRFQAAIFKQLCADYMPNVKSDTLVIVSTEGEEVLAAAFKRAGFTVRVVSPEQVDLQEDEFLYLSGRIDEQQAMRLAKSGSLVVTDRPDWVRRGYASIGIVLRNTQADVVTHIGSLEASGTAVGVGLFRYVRVLDAH